jgi:photosystem II stability/assembly factor-like uncharacterized protein
MKKIYFSVLVLFFQTFLFPQSFNWQLQNSLPTSNNLNTVFAASATNVYAFGDASTQVRSTDGGETWLASYINANNNQILGSWFIDANNGLVCGSNGLIMKTTDGGNTWVTETTGITSILYGIEFADANNGIAAGASGIILKTTDGGTTWTKSTLTGTPTIYHVKVINSTYVLLGTSTVSSKAFFKSTDFGQTFTAYSYSSGTNYAVYGIAATDTSTYYVVNTLGGISKTTNGGTTWYNQTTPAVWGYDLKFQDSFTGYVGDQKGEVWTTPDSGKTWTKNLLAPRAELGFTLRSISFNSGNTFAVGYSGGIYKSTNNGTSWTPKFTTAIEDIVHKIAFSGISNGVAFGGSSTYTDTYGFMIRTTNGGSTWSNLYTGFGGHIVSVSMPTATTWYLGGYISSLYKTTDGGATFNPITTVPTGNTIYWATTFTSDLVGYVGGASSSSVICAKTTDGGTSWTDISTAAGFGTSTIYDIASINTNTVFVVGASSKCVMSTDGGNTFNAFTSGISSTIYSVIKFKDNLLGFLGGNYNKLSKTTDGGTTWNSVTLPSPMNYSSSSVSIRSIIFGDPTSTDVWVSSDSGNVLYSSDNGVNWVFPTRNTVNNIYSLSYYGGNLWAGGANGLIMNSISPKPLPVELSSFSAKTVDNSVQISWKTATETNNFGFEIQRSETNTDNWVKTGFVNGAGNSNSSKQYSFVDKVSQDGKYYYRLKQIDKDGKFTYSNQVEVTVMPAIFALEQNYPNPFNPNTVIKYSIPASGFVKLQVYNALGARVAILVKTMQEAGNYEVNFDASHLASGLYFYCLESGNNIVVKKMTLLK